MCSVSVMGQTDFGESGGVTHDGTKAKCIQLESLALAL